MKARLIFLFFVWSLSPSLAFTSDVDDFSELIAKNKYEETVSRINELILKYPQDRQLIFYRAAIFHHYGKLRKAKEDFLLLSNNHPKDPIFKNNLGVVHAKIGDLYKARICFEAALRLKPDYQEAKNNLLAINKYSYYK